MAGQPGVEDGLVEETWEIHVPTEMKRKLASLWQTSIIIKLMGRQLGYRALQTRLAGIWRPTGKWTLIDIGYGFFIVRFDNPQDYQHALMDGPWFVGDHYLHVQAWEADFHPHVAKIPTTAVWIRLEQLPIEYYHPEFLKHVGNKLGKLLRIDAVTSAAMRGRFARLCMQVNTAYPLPKRVKIGAFWQDIVYENLPMLCYRCGRIGHRDTHCTEPNLPLQDTDKPGAINRDESGPHASGQNHSPWKMVQTRRTRPCGNHTEPSQRSKPIPRDVPTLLPQATSTTSPRVQLLQPHATESVKKYYINTSKVIAGINSEDVDTLGKMKASQRPCIFMQNMQAHPSSSCSQPTENTSSTHGSMQAESHRTTTDTPEHTFTRTSPIHGPLNGPKLIHPHANRPRPPSPTHTPKQPEPTTHSNHELPHSQSPQSSSGNGRTRTDLEWTLTGTIRGRDGELCPHPGPPPNCNDLEPSDPNTGHSNVARTTSPNQSLSDASNPYTRASDSAPIQGTSWPLPSTTGQTTGCSDELFERGLIGPTARSHFPVPGTRRSKHSSTGERGRAIHNNVLKAKPTICRVRHILGTARRTRTSVPNQDHLSTTSVAHSTCSENPEDLGGSI